MKKPILILAALTIGSAAFAQTMPMQGSPPMTNTPAPATPDASAPAADPGQTTTTDSTAPMNGAATNPTTDPAAQTPPDSTMTPPASAAPPAAMGTGMAAAPMADASSYPACSRTVTDKCTQMGGKRMMRKR